jgi:hypothetical protein
MIYDTSFTLVRSEMCSFGGCCGLNQKVCFLWINCVLFLHGTEDGRGNIFTNAFPSQQPCQRIFKHLANCPVLCHRMLV